MKPTFTKLSMTSVIAAMLIGCGGGSTPNPVGEGDNTPNTPNTPSTTPTVTNSTLCGGTQTAFALSKEINGDLNIEKDNTEDCYKIHLSSNKGTETYTFFLYMLPGTEGFTNTEAKLIDTDNEEIPLNIKNKLYDVDSYLRNTFTVTKDGTYYIKIKRGKAKTKYAFSLHPSVANGLKQDKDREINDTPSMAAPITLEEAMKDISGSLHVTRDTYRSLRNSDDTDYYSIDIEKAGKYTFFMNHLPGTESFRVTDVRFIDEAEAEIPIASNSAGLYREHDNIRKEIALTPGKYLIRIQRDNSKTKYAFSLYPSIANGLKQNDNKEPNDTPSIAAPITVEEAASGITGALFTRTAFNSMRNTDNVDYYRITILEQGEYTVTSSLLEGTTGYIGVDVRFIDDKGNEIPLTGNGLYPAAESIDTDVTLTPGDYYLRIYRSHNSATKYNIKMTKKN